MALNRRVLRRDSRRKFQPATDAELTAAAVFTDADMQAIADRWQQVVSPKFKALLGAKVQNAGKP